MAPTGDRGQVRHACTALGLPPRYPPAYSIGDLRRPIYVALTGRTRYTRTFDDVLTEGVRMAYRSPTSCNAYIIKTWLIVHTCTESPRQSGKNAWHVSKCRRPARCFHKRRAVSLRSAQTILYTLHHMNYGANAPWKSRGKFFQTLSKLREKISLLIVALISSAN